MWGILTNRIIVMNLALHAIGYTMYRRTGKKRWLGLMWYVFAAAELLNYFAGFDLYPAPERTKLHYSSTEADFMRSKQLQELSGNLTEGYFPDGKCSAEGDGEEARFNYFIRLLELKPGDRVLDGGCGHGNLVGHLRKRGIDAEGMTITPAQYDRCVENHGDHFHVGDYSVHHPKLDGRFDVIILPGSLEHPFGAHPGFTSSYRRKSRKMAEMFTMFKKYYDPKSPKKLLFTTTLHVNPKVVGDHEAWVLERCYGGLYPLTEKESVADAMETAGYRVLQNEDRSLDYYLASYCDNRHFGNPMTIGLPYALMAFLVYPHVAYIEYYLRHGLWMWMWDRKHHFRREHRVCDPKKGCDLTFEEDIEKRPCTLFYTVSQLE